MEQQLGPDHRQTLYLRFHIANLLRSQGKFSEARDIDARVLDKQREVLPPDHPHTLMTAGSLAADLRALGEFQSALERDQETYERFKDQYGAEHSLDVGRRQQPGRFVASGGRLLRRTRDRPGDT